MNVKLFGCLVVFDARRNRKVFRCVQNCVIVTDGSQTDSGNEFHSDGPETEKTSLSVGRRSGSRYRQIAACCGTEMTSASGGRNRVAHHCKVDWCHLVKTLEYQQTDLDILQTLLNGQPVQSISDVTGDVVVLPFVHYQSSSCIQHVLYSGWI